LEEHYNIALVNSNGSIESGASWSLVRLAYNLKMAGVRCIVIIPCRGTIEKELKKLGIRYYVLKNMAKSINRGNWYQRIDWKNNRYDRLKRSCKKIMGYGNILQLCRIYQKEQIDIVHMNMLTGYTGAVAARICRKKLVWHIRELMEEGLGIEFVDMAYAKKCVGYAKCIIAISRIAKEKYEKIFNVPIKVIYNGVDINKYYCSCDSKWKKSRFNILVSGRITDKKGQLDVVQAIMHLPMEIKKHVKCSIVGSIDNQDYYHKVVRYITENRLQDIVTVENYTNHIERYLREAKIVCMCSECEAFGRATVEGMMAGCIIIGADTGATLELIENGTDGLLYEKGNICALSQQIEWVYHHQDKALEIAQNGQKKALRDFTDEKNARQVLEVYRTL